MVFSLNQCRAWFQKPNIVFPTLAFLLSGLGLVLFLAGLFPLDLANFIFWSVLMGLACLYRPNWCFLFLLALLPFETVNLLPSAFGSDLRPYQWLFLILSLALFIRVVTRRSPWPLFHLHPIDFALGLLVLGAIISGVAHGGEGMRLSLILSSFYFLYLLARVFFKTVNDISLAVSTVTAAGYSVLLYALAQNISFEYGGALTSVMPGRPNGTFAEPDWLGFFVAVLFLLAVGRLARLIQLIQTSEKTFFPGALMQTVLLVPIAAVLITSVSRSAWLSAVLGLGSWFAITIFWNGRSVLRPVAQTVQLTVIVCIVTLVLVKEVPLTRFDLMNRAESTATGLQEITVACEKPTALPEKIETLLELAPLGCRHIDFEERSALADQGYSIALTKRPDPNIEIRSAIYGKTWSEIKAHPLFGIGWGNIGVVLGQDENGAAYNASNLWLEVWLGAGLIGVVALLGFFGWVAFAGGKRLLERSKTSVQEEDSHLLALAAALLLAFFIFNLFNAGLLIGFVWVFLAMLPVVFPARIMKTA